MLCIGKSRKVKKPRVTWGTDSGLTTDLIQKIKEGDEAGVNALIQVDSCLNISILSMHVCN